MLRPVDPSNLRTPLDRTIADASRALERRGYTYQTLYETIRHWRHLAEFADKRGSDTFSVELAVAYMSDWDANHPKYNGTTLATRRAARILVDYHLRGTWERNPKRMNDPLVLPPTFATDLARFLDYWRDDMYMGRSMLSDASRYLTDWLLFLDEIGIRSWSQLCERVISDFFACKFHMSPSSLQHISSVVRPFLQFLFLKRIVERDWSDHVPRFRRQRPDRLPTIWTPEQIVALLRAVDRASPVGKRDYVILLLACRLGMRAGDIRKLRLDDVHWERSSIEFSQQKTKSFASLPLTEEIGEALIDYLRNGRPISDYREVFLKCTPPYDRFSQENKFHGIVTKYRKKAGIGIAPEDTRGMHSLRHTVATRLMEAKVPLETIAGVLGHADLETTRNYARLDIASLRQVALDVEEVQHGH